MGAGRLNDFLKLNPAEEQKLMNDYPIYKDVLLHTSEDHPPETPSGLMLYYPRRGSAMGFAGDTTRIHEVAHMLHAQMTRNPGQSTIQPMTHQGLYFGNGLGVILKNPNFTIGQVRPEIDAIMAKPLSELGDSSIGYVRGEHNQTRNITYLFDEWAAYLLDEEMSLDIYNKVKDRPELKRNLDGGNAVHYFFGYLGIAISKMSKLEMPEEDRKQLQAVFALMAEKSWQQMCQVQNIEKSGDQNNSQNNRMMIWALTDNWHMSSIMDFYRSSSEFARIRSKLRAIYGRPWMDHLLSCAGKT
jgi:hypothetical protein